MPITQEQMLEQVRESRANHAELLAIRDLVLNYITHAKRAYASNNELQETMNALEYAIRLRPIPDDRATYMNERYYARFGKRNAKARERQALARAGAFIPSPRMQRVPLDDGHEHFGKRHYTKPIIPDDSNEPPLEFETLPDMPTLGENNLQSGLDIPLPDDMIGNPSKGDFDDQE